MKIPSRQRLVLKQTLILERKLPEKAKILVKEGQTVVPEDILAQGESAPGFRVLRIALDLDVKPAEVSKFLLKKIGSRVYRGDLIAQKKTFLWGVKKIISPTDGILKDLDSQTGQVTLQFLPATEKLTAGVWGKVEKINEEKITLLTQVLEIQGVAGVGRQREGVLKVICEREDFLLPNNLSTALSGRILIGGALVSSSSLNKALACEIAGIISGGIHFRDFGQLGGGKRLAMENLGLSDLVTDVGLTILILEGFGHLPIGKELFSVLQKYDGRYGIISGNQARLTIPLRPGEIEETVKNRAKDGREEPQEKELTAGEQVRVVGEPQTGVIGKVKTISKEKEKLDSGLESILIEVETEDGKILKVPVENLEIT